MAIATTLREWIADLSNMIFPNTCEVCGKTLVRGEKIICLGCHYNLPLCKITNFTDNFIHQRLMRDVPIDRATSLFFYYRGNSYTNLILSAKYRGRPKIIYQLAHNFAEQLATNDFFDGIDLIIPVPMHRRKQRQRGYNQTEYIARGISDATGLPISDNIVAHRPHATQTRKTAADRWAGLNDVFSIKYPEELTDRHILIVDDIITTGSTLHHCCKTLYTAAPTAKISILTIGATTII